MIITASIGSSDVLNNPIWSGKVLKLSIKLQMMITCRYKLLYFLGSVIKSLLVYFKTILHKIHL